MNDNIQTKLIAVTRELEKIEVRGQSNLASLLGSINFLNQIINDLRNTQEVTNDNGDGVS